jgi:hypothetical protein
MNDDDDDHTLMPARELRQILDPSSGLPGEDPSSSRPEDAVHWISVYSELLSLKRTLISRSRALEEGLTDDALREAHIDERLLLAQQDRYRARLRYWQARARELSRSAAEH